MIEEKKYDESFYDGQSAGSLASARIIIPLIAQWVNPHSILDVGCGVGTWLKIWKDQLKIDDIVGIDGDYVKRDQLQIDQQTYISKDLKEPFDLKRKFDLVMSLEVGEHLPNKKSPLLVENLVRHGDIILFSAAIPEQRGTYHINEQFPEFWARLFQTHNYVPVDIVRDLIWTNNNVEWWYRQNILLYINKSIIADFPVLAERAKHTNLDCLTRIHPLLWQYRNKEVEERSHWTSFLIWKISAIKKSFFPRK